MAINTAVKRESACFFGFVCQPFTVAPDGTISQADRQDIIGCYRGILAVLPVPVRLLIGYLADKYPITALAPKYLTRFLADKYSMTSLGPKYLIRFLVGKHSIRELDNE